MAIKFDFRDLLQMPKRVEEQFVDKLGLKAMERASLQGSNEVKNRITRQEQVRTGNLRNSVVWLKPKKEGGRRITGEIIAGANVGIRSFTDRKTGKTLKQVSNPESYASFVEEQKPYMLPSIPRMQRIVSQELQAALDAWARKESSR